MISTWECFFFFLITPQHFFKMVWQVSWLLTTLCYLSSWLWKGDVAPETRAAEAACQSRAHPVAIAPSLSKLTLALLWKKAKDWNLLFRRNLTSLFNIQAVLQGIMALGSTTLTLQGAAGPAAHRGHSSALVTDWEEPSAGIQLNSLLYFKCFRNLKNTLSNAIIKLSVNLCNKIHQQRRWVI